MSWLKNLMMARYGRDQLSMALLILSLFLSLIAQFSSQPIFVFIGYIALGVGVFRMLSKNISKRSMENYKFSIMISPVYSWFKKTQNLAQDAKTHRFFKCPNCKGKLRLPKGKGKIMITCPKCNTKFAKKT